MMYVPTKYFTIVFMGGALSQTRKDEGYFHAPAVTIIDVVLKTTKQSIGKSVAHLLSQIHKTDSYSFDFV